MTNLLWWTSSIVASSAAVGVLLGTLGGCNSRRPDQPAPQVSAVEAETQVDPLATEAPDLADDWPSQDVGPIDSGSQLGAAPEASAEGAKDDPAAVAVLERMGAFIDSDRTDKQVTYVSIRMDLTAEELASVAEVAAGLPHLRQLSLTASELSPADLAPLAALAGLELLTIDELPTTDGHLQQLTALKNLQQIRFPAEQITDAGAASLGRLTNLVTVRLDDSRVTDAGVQSLKPLRNLNFLFLTGTSVTGSGCEGLRQGIVYDFTGGKVNDEGLAAIAATQPAGLVLDETEVTDAGVKHLEGSPQLRDLSLRGLKITDAAIASLATIEQLESLNLADTEVTEDGAARLKAARPQLEIEQ